jgi:hypothetical protein
MMAITAALPAHMVSLLRENGLSEAWVMAIPASIGASRCWGGCCCMFFEQPLRRAPGQPAHSLPDPAGAGRPAGRRRPWPAALVFVVLYGLGNGMLTIVKGTAIALYVSREHVASLNGALGLPQAAARAAAPLALGLLWSPAAGYTVGLWWLLGASVVAVAALLLAQRSSSRARAQPADSSSTPDEK